MCPNQWKKTGFQTIKIGRCLQILLPNFQTQIRTLRGHLLIATDISDADIMKFNLPNSIPFIFDFDENMKMVGGIRFLANQDDVLKAMEKVASIGK